VTSSALHAQAKRWIAYALLALVPTLLSFAFLLPIWRWLMSLGTATFMVASLALGLVLAAGPVAVAVFGLGALFLRIEACIRTPDVSLKLLDKLIIAMGILVSLAPAVGTLYVPINAILSGYIAFRGPGQQYALVSDPYGFWQAVGFWFMGAATLAFLAVTYWRSRFSRLKLSAKTTPQDSPTNPDGV